MLEYQQNENLGGWEEWSDDYGTYQRKGDVCLVVSRTQKWHDENPAIETKPPVPTLEEKFEALEQEKLILQLALAESIEKQEIDKINNQLAMAELIETLTIKGVL